MNLLKNKSLQSGLCILALTALASPQAHACAVCMGAPDDKVTSAMSSAILFMLVLVMGMMSAFGAFAYYLYWKSCQADDGLDELAEAAYRANPDTAA